MTAGRSASCLFLEGAVAWPRTLAHCGRCCGSQLGTEVDTGAGAGAGQPGLWQPLSLRLTWPLASNFGKLCQWTPWFCPGKEVLRSLVMTGRGRAWLSWVAASGQGNWVQVKVEDEHQRIGKHVYTGSRARSCWDGCACTHVGAFMHRCVCKYVQGVLFNIGFSSICSESGWNQGVFAPRQGGRRGCSKAGDATPQPPRRLSRPLGSWTLPAPRRPPGTRAH